MSIHLTRIIVSPLREITSLLTLIFFLWNISWSFETVRYFGSRHLDVKETRIVILRPRELAEDSSSGSESDEE